MENGPSFMIRSTPRDPTLTRAAYPAPHPGGARASRPVRRLRVRPASGCGGPALDVSLRRPAPPPRPGHAAPRPRARVPASAALRRAYPSPAAR